MSYQDLPKEWPDQPVTEHIEDILDLFVDMQARVRGALFILVCDKHYVPVRPIMIDDVPSGRICDELAEPLGRIAQTIADGLPGATALIAVARTGSQRPNLRDRAWAAAIGRAFGSHVALIGVHVVTPRGSSGIEAQADAA